jgi:Fe-S-cluster containining protein
MQQPLFDIANASDADILATVDAANQQGLSINLNIRATEDNIRSILSSINCRRCGLCCSTGTCPGVRQNGIPLGDAEIIEIANCLKVRARKVKRLCFVNELGSLSLPYSCPFYKSSPLPKCSIYSVRPLTCRMFPLYSIMGGNNINSPPMLTIDSGCPEARDFTLKRYQSMRETIRRGI